MKKLLFTIIILASALWGGAQVPCWDGTVAEAYAGGDGTLENPYQIATPEQLALLAEQTNNGTGGNAYYLLTEDLCLNGLEEYEWIPIGDPENPFTGVFNGNEHSISDMYMTTQQIYSGLFGFTQGATIKDIRIEEANIPHTMYMYSCIGLVVGKALNTNVFNCSASGFVGDCNEACGGIVGLFAADAVDETFIIKDCVNYAEITSQAIRGGGVVGQTTITNGQALVENCANYGNLNVSGINGGIVGEGSIHIKNCCNYGAIITTYDGPTAAGGIAGQMTNTSVIEDCINRESGEIKANSAGGIVGNAGEAIISRCGNKAPIKGRVRQYFVGGMTALVGGITSSGGRISNCYNSGEVSIDMNNEAKGYQIGGISGSLSEPGYIRNVYNTGAVIKPNPGALAGIVLPAIVGTTEVNHCYWYGDYMVPPTYQNSVVLPTSGPFGPGTTSTSWTLEEAQYGTTDLLEALNRGSMGECLWVEDVDGINGGLPIPTEGEVVYPLYGNEWYYEIVNNDGSITYQHLEFAANDTTIHHKDVVIIIKTNTLYDKGVMHQEVTHEYIYQEGNVVYWYNKSEDDFTVLYDFGAVAGDEWEINVGDATVLMHVDSVAFVDYDGETYRKMMVISDQDGAFSGDILCGIGHTTSFFPESLLNKNYRVESIRCYWNDEELIQQWSDADCDEVYEQYHTGLNEPIGDQSLMVYPNPTDGMITISGCQTGEYRITNIMGQTLMTGRIDSEKQPIDVRSLQEGVYFITIGGVSSLFVKQ